MPRASNLVALLLAGSVAIAACDQLTTVAPPDGDVFDAPVEGLTDAEMAAFARGDAEFERQFAPNTGLGPIFNDVSCATCHSGDGRGRPRNALIRIGSDADSFQNSVGGPQIQDKAIPGAQAEQLPPGIPYSLRLPPPVFGAGLIEAIPEAAILANVDSLDADGDGISGRPNFVPAADFVPSSEPSGGAGLKLGRFGRKAQNAVLLQQVVTAYLQDMGITSPFLPTENRNPLSGTPIEAVDRVPDPEVLESTVQAVTHYVRALAPPEPGRDTERVNEGRQLFADIACASCHVPEFQTGHSPIAALRGRTVQLYSDLLLHDMGDGLADNRPDGQANGREWRTAPLWGMRLVRRFLNGDVFLLHDGRARSVEAAILAHGGEAAISRHLFTQLTPAQKAALIEFVETR
ncbi:MAG: di-heme oxidoredictase family protein [Gemmatimonadaceae bacterium]